LAIVLTTVAEIGMPPPGELTIATAPAIDVRRDSRIARCGIRRRRRNTMPPYCRHSAR
jgi:hypothetical protein